MAQLVEHNLAKVGVAGSSPVFRSTIPGPPSAALSVFLPPYITTSLAMASETAALPSKENEPTT